MGDYGKGKEQQKMYIKMNLPGKMGIRIIPSFYSMFLKKKNEVHYIGGSEVLPPPLDAIDEAHYIQGLVNGEEESLKEARSMLIEHNLRLVVYIAKKFDNTGVGVAGSDLDRNDRSESNRSIPLIRKKISSWQPMLPAASKMRF